jgi:hypothetical protein
MNREARGRYAPPMLRRVSRSPRSQFYGACAVGGLAATVICAWVVFGGSGDLFAREPLASFYDAQARSLIHGHWDVPKEPVSFERFNIDGHYYMYFGPWPAVLRMPVIAFTEDLDGRLSRISMLVAFVVLLVFAARLAWQARTLLRGDGPPTRATLIAAAGFVFVTGCGSTALFLVGRAWVFHEAILWGIAMSLASFYFLIAYLTTARGRDLAWTCLTATLALLSRPSVGTGPVIALGFVLAIQLIPRVTTRIRTGRARTPRPERSQRGSLPRWLGIGDAAVTRPAWSVAVAIGIPIALYAYVNYSKFGTLFGLPIDKQDLLLERPERKSALAASNALFSLEYAPTNLLQYLRPDAIGFDRVFPWVTFSAPAHIVGHVPFDNIEPSASIPAASTLLVALAVFGIVAAIRMPHPATGRGTAAVLRVPILAAALGTIGTIVLGVQLERYEGDFVPLLVIAGAAGLFWLPVLLTRRPRLVRNLARGALVALAAWSVWATFSLTLRYQRAYSAFQPTSVRAGFVSFQLDINDTLGLGRPFEVRRGATLPIVAGKEFRRTSAPLGRLFIVGDCTGLFLSTARTWEPVEEKPTGALRWRVTFGRAAPPGTREPLWSTHARGSSYNSILWARWIDDQHIGVEYEWTGMPDAVLLGQKPMRIQSGRAYELDVRLDPNQHYVEVRHGKRVLLTGFPPVFDDDSPSTLGRQTDSNRGSTTFNGTIRTVPTTPICDRVMSRHQLSTIDP